MSDPLGFAVRKSEIGSDVLLACEECLEWVKIHAKAVEAGWWGPPLTIGAIGTYHAKGHVE